MLDLEDFDSSVLFPLDKQIVELNKMLCDIDNHFHSLSEIIQEQAPLQHNLFDESRSLSQAWTSRNRVQQCLHDTISERARLLKFVNQA